jgi:2,3-bisphosphoglycerate-dependent phosphoglycerate mutase
MVYKRAVTFYLDKIVPPVVAGENVLVVSHGNAIRAMMKYIERIPDEKVRDIEMLFGEVVIYEIDLGGHMITKEIRKVKSTVNA